MQYTANCGPVVPPVNGYIMNYTSTLEDANVTIVCDDTWQAFIMASCNAEGRWDPNPSEFCLDNIDIVCICVFVCVCVHMCAHVRACVCVFVFVCMMCVCVHILVSVCTWVCVYKSR